MPENPETRRWKLVGLLRKVTAHPLKLRGAISVIMLVGWYFGAYAPISTQIEEAKQQLAAEVERRQLGQDVEKLRGDLERIQPRIPPDTDRNSWLQFLMDGIRAQPIRLVSLEPGSTTEIGPYKAAQVTITVEGAFADGEKLLRWIETIPRLHRINLISMSLQEKTTVKPVAGQAPREPEVQMRIVLMGILGSTP